MKGILLFFFVIFLNFQVYTQTINNWSEDLDTLKHYLSQKDYLFTKNSKDKFVLKMDKLKQYQPLDIEDSYWKISEVLAGINNDNVHLNEIEFKRFPFVVKQFADGFYITQIHPKFSFILGYQLQRINNFTLNQLLKKNKKVETLNIKSFLTHYHFTESDTISLDLLSDKKEMITVKLIFDNFFDNADMVKVIPKKTPFYLEKSDRWFWQYGINFGQQVYFKYNIGLSAEFFEKVKDSLAISELSLAKNYGLPLQSIYDAPRFDDFTERLFLKLKKRRYKKLFIDFRNNKTGNVLAFKKFIKKLKNLRRINKKNNLFLFVDKTVSSSVIETILLLQNESKITIFGEEVKGISCSTDKIKNIYLPNLEFQISYPQQSYKSVIIKPDILISYTFLQYQNGIDPILQKALNY